MVSRRTVSADACPRTDALTAYTEGRLGSTQTAQVDLHVDDCEQCRLSIATITGTQSTVGAKPGASRKKANGLLPSKIARFEIDSLLGEGGMGAVYRAMDPTLKRHVAVKVLRHGVSSQNQQRLVGEARAMAKLSHPNILPIYEVGMHEGTVFIAMEYVPGLNLRDWLRKHKPSWREILQAFIDAGKGLQAAHGVGLVHRDFKPDNVLVGDDGRVRVADFGLAKTFAGVGAGGDEYGDADRPVTRAGAVVGTPGYISPEQFACLELTAAADQFSYCAALFEALFQRQPFRGHDAFAVHDEVMAGRIVEVTLGDIPARAHAVACRGLNSDPNQRFGSLDELLAELAPLVASGEAKCPYTGLSSFGEHDAQSYVGHEDALLASLAVTSARRVLTIVGPSGAGKSSFVRAGLLPRLRQRDRWQLVELRPGHSPMRSLAQALGAKLQGPLGGSPLDSLRRVQAQEQSQVLLFVDQFEELFTQCSNAEERGHFLDAIAEATMSSDWGCAVLCVRSDFLDELGGHHQLSAQATRGLVYLSPPDAQLLRDAILRPLDAVGFELQDDAIAETIVEELCNRAGALPLLQFAMARLWDARDKEARLLTSKAFQEMGSVAGALARHADRVIAALPGPHREVAKKVLRRLVTIEKTRDSVSIADLQSVAPEAPIDEILGLLVEARLVIARGDEDGQVYELIHESLITHWPSLAGWLEQQRGDAAYVREVAGAAKQWILRGRAHGLLWRDDAADELASWHRQRVGDTGLGPDGMQFVEAVLAARRSTQRRKRRVLAAAFVSLALVAGGALLATWLVAGARNDALSKADEARKSAIRARDAEREVRDKVQRLQREKRQRELAEQKAAKASSSATLSREQLVESLARTEKEREKAREAASLAARAAKRAEDAAERERKAARAAEKARRETQKLLAEKERQLKKALRRKRKIVDDL